MSVECYDEEKVLSEGPVAGWHDDGRVVQDSADLLNEE
jgi:hypothetical protein